MSDPVAAPTETNEPGTAPAAAAPGLIDRAKAALRSKPDLQAEVSRLTAENSTISQELTEARATVERLTTENATLTAEQAELSEMVATAEAEAKTTTAAAVEMVAETGIPEADLPTQEADEESFEARYEAAKAEGPRALAKFMQENRSEVRQALRAK